MKKEWLFNTSSFQGFKFRMETLFEDYTILLVQALFIINQYIGFNNYLGEVKKTRKNYKKNKSLLSIQYCYKIKIKQIGKMFTIFNLKVYEEVL